MDAIAQQDGSLKVKSHAAPALCVASKCIHVGRLPGGGVALPNRSKQHHAISTLATFASISPKHSQHAREGIHTTPQSPLGHYSTSQVYQRSTMMSASEITGLRAQILGPSVFDSDLDETVVNRLSSEREDHAQGTEHELICTHRAASCIKPVDLDVAVRRRLLRKHGTSHSSFSVRPDPSRTR